MYQIGVLDDGHLIGLDQRGLEDSFECLKYMANELGFGMSVQRILSVIPLQVIQHKPQKRIKKSINDGIGPSEPLSLEEQQSNQELIHSLLDNIHNDVDDDDLDHLFYSDVVESKAATAEHVLSNAPLTPPKQSTLHQIAEILIYAP